MVEIVNDLETGFDTLRQLYRDRAQEIQTIKNQPDEHVLDVDMAHPMTLVYATF